MLIKEQKVIIAEDLLLDVVMPYMEEGVEEGKERAYLLLGEADNTQIKIENVVRVPRENCQEDRFTRFSEEEERKFEEEWEKEKLGYVHLHPPSSDGFQPFWLSKGDYTEMMERDEKICGIIQSSDSLKKEIFVDMIIVFWGRDSPKPLPVHSGECKSDYCLYLKRVWRLFKATSS